MDFKRIKAMFYDLFELRPNTAIAVALPVASQELRCANGRRTPFFCLFVSETAL
jgi:hypothetical protein